MLDWANEPNPFRCYIGARLIPLDRKGINDLQDRPSQLDIHSLSSLFFNSLALSAWKSAGGSTWSIRVNPSSGDLHPTECYLISGNVEGIVGSPGIFHYTSKEHALEQRSEIKPEDWNVLRMPDGSFLVGLSSIYWRESWKYGERAFRYCLLDAGHAIACIAISAACLGWQAKLIDDLGTDDLDRVLGITAWGPESERAECLMAIFSDGLMHDISLPKDAPARLYSAHLGRPNALSPEHVDWPAIDIASTAAKKPSGLFDFASTWFSKAPSGASADRLPSKDFCRVLRRRRSAQAMDGRTYLSKDRFFEILGMTLPGGIPFSLLPWKPYVNLALFVNRIQDLEKGLYFLLRDPLQKKDLMKMMRDDFSWEKPPGCPESLELYRLAAGDMRRFIKEASCNQSIASDGCFVASMIAEFERPLMDIGSWFYPRQHFECGMIGQSLYLGAEAFDLRGCGMGCYLDDVVHEALGIRDLAYQDLYHFTVGRAVEDPRLTTFPAYK